MKPGRFIAVVGPSGVGKDSVMAGIKASCPDMRLVRRTITRAPNLEHEDFNAVSIQTFTQAAQDGAFCLHWSAHGLHYGIPADVHHHIARGTDCLANLSRDALSKAADAFATLLVLNITAAPEVLAQRLAGRGRETATEIAARLQQAAKPLPPGLRVVTVSNDGTLDDTIAAASAALQPERA